MARSRFSSSALVSCSLLLGLGLLGPACVSARSEPARAPADAGVASVDAGVASVDAGVASVDAGPPCAPRSCVQARARCGVISDGCGGSVDCGPCTPRCGPDELECCGSCFPRSEGRCPDNIHCRPPAPAPEEATE
ncbi:hypothetical protein NR798_22760 [Archangium gephyra]|uniref:hypothetical protein n=1 Tax=Archangium gephyra TaxID=48 RepID=UPI0035D4E5C5